MTPRPRLATAFAACLLLLACNRTPVPGAKVAAAPPVEAATRPAQAVRQLTAHLRANELDAFAHEAVPPALHKRLQVAWREGRTRWPLDELPFGRRLPGMLAGLSAPGAEAHLQQLFDRQFAGADRELHNTATSLGLFGAQYIDQEADYSPDERQHYAQLVAAASRWGAKAPLGDRKRAAQSLRELSAAARRTRLGSEQAFRAAGMDASLQQVGPFAAAVKQVLKRYGLDLDADLATQEARLLEQTGDQARVRIRYRLAGSEIDTVASLQRIDGRWYLVDFLRNAEAAVLRPPATPAAAASGKAPPTSPRR
jgi:chorismate mutase